MPKQIWEVQAVSARKSAEEAVRELAHNQLNAAVLSLTKALYYAEQAETDLVESREANVK